jgi:hypothetical protein
MKKTGSVFAAEDYYVHMVAVAASNKPPRPCSAAAFSLGLFADGCLAYARRSSFFVLLGER